MRVSQKLSLLICALTFALISCTSCAHSGPTKEDLSVAVYTQQVYPLVQATIGLFRSTDTGMRVVGTGVVLECKAGETMKVMTADHVVEALVGDSEKGLIFGGTKMKKSYKQFNVLLRDGDHDIALIQGSSKEDADCPTVPVAKDLPSIGSYVWVVGYPLGVERNVSHGVLSSAYFAGKSESTYVYRIDAPIAPGNSGGGLFNEKGELIGIISYMQLMMLPLPALPIIGSVSPVAGGGHAIGLPHLWRLIEKAKDVPPASNPVI